ncbi:MAG: DUF1488 domain-containing protein [Gammaproteobacteria bacterium]|nr:DUF1488 domain-containing protein [Gammaproteobacteria bacterium]
MTMVFPKSGYSFDARRRRVCFWGYGSGIEVQFFVEENALKRLCPEMIDTEVGFLQAFEHAHNKIIEVAEKVYVYDTSNDSSYILEAKDF